jgi:hypothetical protein
MAASSRTDAYGLYPLPAAYHWLITNEWSTKFGQQRDPQYYRPEDPQEYEDFAQKLENKYPLTPCQE